MPVRVKYRRTELSEGEHETFERADHYEIAEDNTVLLFEHWTDEDTGKAKKRQVGAVHPERWESVIVVESAGV